MDPLRDLDRLEFIKQQLALYPGEKKDDGTHVKILCPFHTEKTPSASVNLGPRGAPGWLHCFGCGKDSRYDDWAEAAGLEPYKKGPPQAKHAMGLLMSASEDEADEPESPHESDSTFKRWKLKHSPLPTGKRLRTIPTDLLIELGGRLCIRHSKDYGWGSTKYIDLPVMINGEQKGMFLARLKKHEDRPSYELARSRGSTWSKTWGLWPFDYAVKMMHDIGTTTMVLVEGQRDALRLLLNDIPAVCIFGTQSWSSHKAKLMELAGVETVVQFFDGDAAGISATKKSAPDLRPLFRLKTIQLWSIKGSPYLPYADIEDDTERQQKIKKDDVQCWDPGNCPQWIVDKLKRKFL